MADRSSLPALQFGEFVLDVAAYELRQGDRSVRLERLAMDLLMLLVERRDQLVTRGEIAERLWGPDVFLEIDASVNTLIRKIRRALHDPVEQPRFIQTVQGKGYRFIAAVSVIPAASPLPAPVSDPPAPPIALDPEVARASGRRREDGAARTFYSRTRLVAWTVAAALAVTVGWSWHLRRVGARAPVVVAVLPFENLSGDAEREYLADGLTDETAASLGQTIDPERVTILARVATRPYKGSAKSAAEIGMELGAEYLIVGSLQAEDDRVRVTSTLVRVRDQAQVWSQTYAREPVSLLSMQQELGAAVAQQVRLQRSPERVESLIHRQTDNAEAYDLYLRGRYYWNQLTPATTKRALDAYSKATALDPHYALAWSGIADAYTTGPIMGDARPLGVRDLSRHAADRAVRAGSRLAEPHTSAAVHQFFLEWDWRRAEASFRQAITIDPSYAMAHRLLGVMLSHGSRHDEARRELRRARELEPNYVMNHALSVMVEYHAGDLEAAIAHARRALALDPEFWIAHYQLAQVLEGFGRTDAALEALASAARFSNHSNSKPLALRGYILARAGRRSDAADTLSTFEAISASRYVPPYARALVYAGLGDLDQMFGWLEQAFVERDVHLIFLTVDPKWQVFRKDARFQDLVRRCDFLRAR